MSCNHGPNEMCIRCMGKADPGHLTKGKCNHGPGGVCANCINKKRSTTPTPPTTTTTAAATTTTGSGSRSSPSPVPETPAQKAKAEAERAALYKRTINKCNHGPHERCIHCIGGNSSKNNNEESGTMIRVSGARPVLVPPKHQTAAAAATATGTTALSSSGSSKDFACQHDPNTVCIHCRERKCGKTFDPNTVTVDADTGSYVFINECDPETVRIVCPNHGPRGVCTYCMGLREAYRVRIDQGQSGPRWIDQVRIDPNCTGNFVHYFALHCVGGVDPRKSTFRRFSWAYGTYDVARRTVSIDACFEPPQEWGRVPVGALPSTIDPKADPAAEQVAAAMGLRRVGCIIRRPEVKNANGDVVLLTAEEVVFLARMQLRFGPQFCCILFDYMEKPHIYQVSDAAVILARKRLLKAKCPDNETVPFLKPARIGPKEVTESDPARLTVTVPYAMRKEQRGAFLLNSFPLANRPELPVTNDDIKKHIAFAKSKGLPPLADFGFLVYLVKNKILSPASDIPVICSCLREYKNPKDIEENLEGFMLILSEF